jgi:hypothetical protein
MRKVWEHVFSKVELNKSNLLLDTSYQKGFEVGIAYFASYNGSALPDEIEIPAVIAYRGGLSHVAFKMGVEDGWKFADRLK